ncbi:hypothetical protein NK214_05640 [Chromobacterium sp. S0633]|uniref:hypothetical protein n=1 Tax=Chromobacterium sp. S0633 TaxID=2957805 RepID=UPI00209E8893|nr:hypothetical protein [Chromobacterium sp. S0633]MCP1289669.1 hypothetical protein [Chromobacterium sp. S0633]
MNVGTQFKFPNGFGSISSNQTLYLLSNSSSADRVICVELVFAKNTRRADFHFFQREEFEQGLLDGQISMSEEKVPVWLERIKGLNIQTFEAERTGAKRSNYECAEARECIIQPLVAREKEIFSSSDPAKFIADWVKDNAPDQNATRVRFWLSCYLVFGRDSAALYPSYCRIGQYDRTPRSGKNYSAGRPARAVCRGKCKIDKDVEKKIENGYVRHAGHGVTEVTVYSNTLETEFGCTVKGKGEGRRIISPGGKPYPTFNQFRYRVRKLFKPDMLRETRYGTARVRNNMTPDAGRFSEGVANILEKAEADGDYLDEQLVDFDGQPFGDSFCRVTFIDQATNCRLGIGFATGAENLSAYQMALFCAAVSKSYFGRLLGVEISDEEWPCRGLPAHVIVDRGPGASVNLVASKDLIPFIEMVGSFQPKSKATVESSHPRMTQMEGAPMTYQSAFTPVEAAKREVLRAIKANWSGDASERMTPDMIRSGVAPNPTAIWAYLDRRARTSGYEISLEKAIRTFLTPVQFTVTRNCIKLGHRRFDSAELCELGFRGRIPKGQTLKVSGYAMNLCVKYAWLEVDNRLVEVQALLPIRDDERQLYVSLDEFKAEQASLNQGKAKQEDFNVAVTMSYRKACVIATGKEPTAGRWRAGKKNRSRSRKAAAGVTKKATMHR